MGLIQNLLSKLGAVTKDDLNKLSSKGEIYEATDYTNSYRRRTQDVLTFEQMYQYYKYNEWVRACVDLLVNATAKIKPVIVPIDESKKDSQDTLEHIKKVEDLLDNPNAKDESFESLRRKILKDILIYDAGALEIVYDNDNEPWEIYDLPGPYIKLNVDDFGNFKDEEKAYCLISKKGFSAKENLTWFKLSEVIYFLANPKAGHVYGLSPLESLVNSVKADLSASEYNANFFTNNAEAAGIIGISDVKPSSLTRFIERWKQNHKGTKNAHRLAFTSGNVSYARTSANARDMQFMEYQKWLLQKILTVYRVPPFVLGIVDGTTGKLNSTEQYNLFKEQAIDPLLSLEEYFYTTKLIKAGFGFDDIKLTFESADIKDEEKESKIMEVLVKNRIITVNEARRIYLGLKDVEWGDKPQTPQGISLAREVEGAETKEIEKEIQDHSNDNALERVQEKIRDIISDRTRDL